jgi:hypothetical protein
MRVRFAAALVLATLAVGGCGGDDDEPSDSGATGAQGPSGAEATDITAEEFLSKLLPEKEIAVEAVIATEPECMTLKVEPALVLVISDAAASADPDTPLTELVVKEC